MGWAGPAQPTGPDSAPNVLGRFRPKMDWADLGPKKLLSSSGPDPAQKTGLGQDPPGPTIKTGGGNYFPPTPACRTLFVLHAEKKRKINAENEGEEELPGAEAKAVACCVSGGGGGVVAHRQRLQAAQRLFPTAWFVLSVPPFLFVFSVCFFFCCFRVGPSSLPVPLLCFVFLSSFSLLRSISSPLSPLFFFVFSLLLLPPSSAFLGFYL